MGFFGRLLGTDPQGRLAKARRFVERGRYNDARLELEGLELPEAQPLRDQVFRALVQANVEEAQACYSSGDTERAKEHLELARQFGATSEQLRDVRRQARELAAARQAEEAAQAAAEEAAHAQPQGDDPLWGLPPDHPRLRFAMLVEAWPEDLRERLVALGDDYASAVLLMENGRHAEAHKALGAFTSHDPVARYDRARAALGAGLLPAAASDLYTFGDKVGHRRIGPTHTAVLLAQVLTHLGRADEALNMLDNELQRSDDLALSGTRASILEALGRYAEAEQLAAKLLLTATRDLGLYRLLGRTRLAQGNRIGAMQALEGGLVKVCSTGGCGSQPFDVESGRLLARLYLEDRLQPKRTQELLDDLRRNVASPGWEDDYLLALVARNEDNPQVSDMVQRLLTDVPQGDPRRARVAKAFGQATTTD